MDGLGPILVVDDDAGYRYALRRSLQAAGLTVRATGSGYEALRLIEGDRSYAALSLDIRMGAGEPNGFALARLAQQKRAGLPVVFLTGFNVDRAEAERAVGPILSKSLGIEAAVEAILRVARERAATTSLDDQRSLWQPGDLAYLLSQAALYEEAAQTAALPEDRQQARQLAASMRKLATEVRQQLGEPDDGTPRRRIYQH